MRLAKFTLDELLPEPVEGFTDDNSWNGWGCPLFTKENAEAVLNSLQENVSPDSLSSWEYHPENDAFIVYDASYPDEPVTYQGIEVNGQQYYPIGAFTWVWKEVK